MNVRRLLTGICLIAAGCPRGGVLPEGDKPQDSGPRDSEPDDSGDPPVDPDAIDLALADLALVGEEAHDYAGGAVSSAGDVDGDGLADLLVGAPGADAGGVGAGRAYLVISGQVGSRSSLDLSDASVVFTGEATGDGAGGAVAAAGDVDGDGLADLLVGAYRNDDGAGSAGKAYLLAGADLALGSAVGLDQAAWSFVGEEGAYGAGVSVAGGGDVNGDGLDDVLIGAVGRYATGYVHLVLGTRHGAGILPLGSADLSLSGVTEGDNAGLSPAMAGDVDGDGLNDVLVGAFGNNDSGDEAGKVYLLQGDTLGGASDGDLAMADTSLSGERTGDAAGLSVAGTGDVDGDGLADLLVGAPCNDDGGDLAGKAYLVLGSTLTHQVSLGLAYADHSFTGEEAEDRAGQTVADAGDVDGDGLSDLLIGAMYNDQGGEYAGKAYLVLGSGLQASSSLELADADMSWLGQSSGDLASRALAGPGDVDGDSLADLFIGATHTNTGGLDAGKAYLLLAAGFDAIVEGR